MLCLGITPKKEKQNDYKTSLILNTEIQTITDTKKFRKTLKIHKNNTASLITKKINLFVNKMKLKKENHQKFNNNEKIIRIINSDLTVFLNCKLKKKYNLEKYTYNIKKINELVFNIPSKFTANFKDFLIIEEDAEFLKREYYKEEFNKKFKKIFYFYEKYSKTFPNYTILQEGKYMYKNILKKQKIIDELQKIKEEEEERTNSKIMEISNETIFTVNTLESIINQNDSFWLQNLQNIIDLEKNEDDSYVINKLYNFIQIISQLEEKIEEKSNKETKYKKEFKKIKNLSKPLHINQINPRLAQIKEKINRIKNYRNNFKLNKKSKNNKTIESSYNSFSTSVNNRSFNNKGKTNNNQNYSKYEEKNQILKKLISFPKDSSYKKASKEKGIVKERLNNLSNNYHKHSSDKSQYESKFSNSMITNKIKNYFTININNYEKKKPTLNSQKKSNNSYNIGSLFNSRKDKSKDFSTDKKLNSVFNKYIQNKKRQFKKRSYLNTESGISQLSIKNDFVINCQYNLNPRIHNTEINISKRSYEYNTNKSKKKSKNNNNNLNKTNAKSNVNTSQNSFLDHTFFSLKKDSKKEFNFSKINDKKIKKKNTYNLKRNKILKSKILNKNNNKNNLKLFNSNKKIQNFAEKNPFKTFNNGRRNTNSSINNSSTFADFVNQSLINRKKKSKFEKKIILSGFPIGRNEKFIHLIFPWGNTFHNKKGNGKSFNK